MPFWAFAFEAPQPPVRLLQILSGNTGRGGTGLSYYGYVRGTYFLIMKTLEYRNSGNPLLVGRITGSGGISRVRVFLTLHPLLWLMLAFATWWWGAKFTFPVVIAWVVVGGGFAVELRRAQRELRWAMGLEDTRELNGRADPRQKSG